MTSTIFSLFNTEIKVLLTPLSADPIFYYTNEILFFFFLSEFMCLFIFEKNYIGTFFFYLDLLAVVSMIPDTDFIMNAFFGNDVSNMQTTNHIIRASSASQAGAR